MILTVFERANLLNVLPREGNFVTLKTIRKLREALALTEDEIAKWQPKFSENGRMEWRIADDGGKPIPQEAEIEIGEQGKEIIRTALKKLNDSNVLKDEHYTLYEKFVGE